jgi:hypothetical protein
LSGSLTRSAIARHSSMHLSIIDITSDDHYSI